MTALISEQVIELAFNPLEPRDAHGRWTRGAYTQPPLPGMPAPETFSHLVSASAGAFRHQDEGMKRKATAEVLHALAIQAKIVPHIIKNEKITYKTRVEMQGDDSDPDVTVEGATSMNSIDFSTTISDAMTDGQASKEARESRDNGWWAPADPQYTMVDTVVAHETGHVIANNLSFADRWDYHLWVGVADALGMDLPPHGVWDSDEPRLQNVADMGAWMENNQYEIARTVSNYGASDPFELGAELWSEYTMSSHPRPAALLYGQRVLAMLGEKA